MTQAFNLSQLANNLNTSGQLDATDGLTGAVPVANGGTGQSTLTANAVLIGNGTSGITSVAPSTSGNILTSNGTTWVSSTPAGGGVTSLNGQTGAITNTDWLAIGSWAILINRNAGACLPNATTAASNLMYVTSINDSTDVGFRTSGAINSYAYNTYYGDYYYNGWFVGNTGNTTSVPTGVANLSSGTWRCMGAVKARTAGNYNSCNNVTPIYYGVSLWVRVS